MDTVGVMMLVELVLGPEAKRKRGKALMIWDNCGCHKVAAVRAVFEEWGVDVMELPPKMTDMLQVMVSWTGTVPYRTVRRYIYRYIYLRKNK